MEGIYETRQAPLKKRPHYCNVCEMNHPYGFVCNLINKE